MRSSVVRLILVLIVLNSLFGRAQAVVSEPGLGPFMKAPENSPACPANMKWVLMPMVRPPHTPIIAPTPTPTPTPTPKPTPTPEPTLDPAATPTPTPDLSIPYPHPRPTPPPPPVPEFPPEPTDPKVLGIPLLDQALAGKASVHLLPYWHNYQWRKVERPNLMTQHLYKVLSNEGAEMVKAVPKDMDLFCPNYKNLNLEQKRIVWLRMISVMTEFESTFRPHRAYHSVRVEWGLYSVGLLMLSLPSAQQRRFGCDFVKSYDDLYDWRKNLTCAVKIMETYFSEDQSITGRTSFSKEDSRWQGLARYFELFRDQRYRKENLAPTILENIKQKRRRWLREAKSNEHPSNRDAQYETEQEPLMERMARLVYTMPICGTGTDADFLDEVQGTPPGPYICVPR